MPAQTRPATRYNGRVANPQPFHLLCPAKVNLALSVGPPRADGLHPIASWMIALAFGDALALRAADHASFHISFDEDAPQPCAVDWPMEQDLAYRAWRLLEQAAGRSIPVAATIEKRIPPGAGLGGGSSDAAAMLVALNQFANLDLSADRLSDLAMQLGSDVAFLVAALTGRPGALVSGVGERIEPVDHAVTRHLLLILPPLACATGAVYRAFDQLRGGHATLQSQRVRELAAGSTLEADALFNDLAEPACHVQPALRSLRDRVAGLVGRPVHITGSGAAMFILAEDHAAALRLAQTIRAATDLPCIATRSLPVSPTAAFVQPASQTPLS